MLSGVSELLRVVLQHWSVDAYGLDSGGYRFLWLQSDEDGDQEEVVD